MSISWRNPPFSLRDPGDILYSVPLPPPPPAPARPRRPVRPRSPITTMAGTPASVGPLETPRMQLARAWGYGAGTAGAEPPPPPALPTKGAIPPVGGVPQPMVDSTSVAEEDREEDLLATWNRLFPPDRDYLAAAKEKLGPEPEGAGEFRISPFELMSMALPALFGSPEGSAAMYRGALGGHLQRGQLASEAREKYAERAGKLAEQVEAREERRALGLLPYEREKASERARRRISEQRLALDRQRESFNQSLRSAQFAFDQFQWANPSAYQQQSLRLRGIDQAIRDAYYRAQEANAAGRLDEAKKHNRVVEDLTRQARDLTRQQIDIARQHLAQGGPAQTLSLYKFVEEQVQDLQAEMNYAFDPEQRNLIEEDLRYYRGVQQELRPRVTGPVGTQGATGGGAAAGGKTYPLKTRPGETVTSAEVQQMIRSALAGGKTRAEIRASLEADGIPPENFGL